MGGEPPGQDGPWAGWTALPPLPCRPKATVFLWGPQPGASGEMWPPGVQELQAGLRMEPGFLREHPPICAQNRRELCE